MKKSVSFILAVLLMLSLLGCGAQSAEAEQPAGSAVTVTDMIGREVMVIPGSYTRVVCVGAGALRMYAYIGDVSLLCGVEDIENVNVSDRPAMFDSDRLR